MKMDFDPQTGLVEFSDPQEQTGGVGCAAPTVALASGQANHAFTNYRTIGFDSCDDPATAGTVETCTEGADRAEALTSFHLFSDADQPSKVQSGSGYLRSMQNGYVHAVRLWSFGLLAKLDEIFPGPGGEAPKAPLPLATAITTLTAAGLLAGPPAEGIGPGWAPKFCLDSGCRIQGFSMASPESWARWIQDSRIHVPKP
jgi:hypothetical protein